MNSTASTAKRLARWALAVATTTIVALGSSATIAHAATPTKAPKAPAKTAKATTKATTTKATTTGLTAGDHLIIPAIGFDKKVVVGWTKEINQGNITLVGDCWPGTPRTTTLPCSTTWIAGHYSTHGSPFHDLPKVHIGDTVRITHNGTTTTYKITSKQIVNRANPPQSIFQQDLLLQCSHGTTQAWAVNATIVP